MSWHIYYKIKKTLEINYPLAHEVENGAGSIIRRVCLGSQAVSPSPRCHRRLRAAVNILAVMETALRGRMLESASDRQWRKRR